MLDGKRVVITGAGGALGRAVVEQARSQGAEVIALDLAFASSDFQTGDQQIAVDLTDVSAVSDAFARIASFDALFNLAGGFAMGSKTWDSSDEDWDRLMLLNVKTLRTTLKAAVPLMLQRGSGRIVNVGALGARSGAGNMSAYCASKSVVMRLTESLSEELRHAGINVNAVLPSVIDTPQNRAGMPDADPSLWVSPQDLAKVICFLASDAARAIHGALIPVRGLS